VRTSVLAAALRPFLPSPTVALAVCLGLWPVGARADRQLGVGVCLPEAPFADALERHRTAKQVAQHLSHVLRRPVNGAAYINPEDLRRDIRMGTLHFAVVGALFAATVPRDQILAQGNTEEGDDWSILCRSRQELKDLKGKRLQIPALGPATLSFVQNGVIGGRVDVKSHFKIQWSPDLLSAQLAVLLNQADAVVAPISGQILVPVLPGYAVPPPAFVLVDRQVPAEVVEEARRGFLSFRSKVGTVKGWVEPAPNTYRKLAAFTRKQELRMELLPEAGIPLDVHDLIRKKSLLPRMPALEPLDVR